MSISLLHSKLFDISCDSCEANTLERKLVFSRFSHYKRASVRRFRAINPSDKTKMTRKILIDAIYPEEIRVAVVESNQETAKIEEFFCQYDFRKNKKGNIYLAKVDRVEPSLQAAFVNYGEEKHGFLPFGEIHPSCYQIPGQDKAGIIQMLERDIISDDATIDYAEDHNSEKAKKPIADSDIVRKRYNIQDVVKPGQVLLVQVTKEERGNKGATLTTYLSLAGRYCVMNPDSTSLGGVARRIEDPQERQRLKGIISEISEHKGRHSFIVRTAGAHKTKAAIKNDAFYLMRMWRSVKKYAKSSLAPAFLYQESNIILRTLRDTYSNNVDEILIAGTAAYDEALEFMKLLLPKHVNKVKEYTEFTPIFTRYRVEEELTTLYQNTVQLSSGGYLVINQTEALVSIDVNSGKSTGESSVENTAFKTNAEAVAEIVRQIKLRDLSGLIVIDFIDMASEENRIAVHKKLCDSLSGDRAKTQIGKISEFGLIEMTRQRMGNSIFESNFVHCADCAGRGTVRVVQASALVVLRALRQELEKTTSDALIEVSGGAHLILYLLNEKKEEVAWLERKCNAKIFFYIDEKAGYDNFFIERKERRTKASPLSLLSEMEIKGQMKNYHRITKGESEQYESRKKEDEGNGRRVRENNSHRHKVGPNRRNVGREKTDRAGFFGKLWRFIAD